MPRKENDEHWLAPHEVILEPAEELDLQLRFLPEEVLRGCIQNAIPTLKKRPYISGNVAQFILEFLERKDEEARCWTLKFDCKFYRNCIYEGFLPTSIFIGQGIYLFEPWIDPERCVLDWSDVKVKKKFRKNSQNYILRVNTCFMDVIKGCIGQHGENWLYPPLRDLLSKLNAGKNRCVHSVEMFDKETGALVAGDLGYTVGSVYTSMSGFRLSGTKNLGTMQMLATAKLLEALGFAFWDLGMVLDYKLQNLYGRSIHRKEFRGMLIQHRDNKDVKLNIPSNGSIVVRKLLTLKEPSTANVEELVGDAV